MSNGARHAIGVVIGLIVTPVIAGCLLYGTSKLSVYFMRYYAHGNDRWTGAFFLLVAAVAIGLVGGTRVSPLASLVPGAAFALLGALWLAAPRWSIEHTSRKLPDELDRGYAYLGPGGVLLVLGVALLVASVPPARWRGGVAAGAPYRQGPPPMPMSGPAALGGVPRPVGAPPAPGMEPSSWQPQQPHYGPPAQPPGPPPGGHAQPGAPDQPPGPYGVQAPSPAGPSASPPPSGRPRPGGQGGEAGKAPQSGPGGGEGVGEWTQMYGGDDLRGGR